MNAYALKKIAPRLLIGIILINISIYLVVGMADLTRVLGRGVGGLITAPFSSSDNYNFTLGDLSGQQVAILAGGGFFLGRAVIGSSNSGSTGGIQKVFSDIFGGSRAPAAGTTSPDTNNTARTETIKKSLHAIIFAIVIPIALIAFAIMITLIFRQGLLILLAITAPIACVLYILPNTEKWAKKWLELYWKTLLMYPIIMIIFAISDVLASIIFRLNADSIAGLLAGLIAMFAPLVLVPFSFKFAGGALSAIYGAVTSGQAKLGEFGAYKENRERAKHWWGEQKTEGQLARIEKAEHRLKHPEGVGRAQLYRAKRMRASGSRGDIIEKAANMRAEQAKRAAPILQYGDEQFVRAITATKQTRDVKDRAGNIIDQKTGYWSLDGREVSEGEALAARKMAAGNSGLQRAALAHAINKTSDPSEYEDFFNGLNGFQQTYNMSDEDMHLMLDSAGQETHRPEFRRTETIGGKTHQRVDKTLGDMRAQTAYQAVGSAGADEALRDQGAMATHILEKQEKGMVLSEPEEGFLKDFIDNQSKIQAASRQAGGTEAMVLEAQTASGTPIGTGAGAQTSEAIRMNNLIKEKIVNTADPKYDPPIGPPPPDPSTIPPPTPGDAGAELTYQREVQERKQEIARWEKQAGARKAAEKHNQEILDARQLAKDLAAKRNKNGDGLRLKIGDGVRETIYEP